ncbi:TPA: HAD family hydrolase [Campylobacter lari]|uniref:HAD family hydrolase n=1 Tax=Campylobacter TaxID=194 RepID=UPI0010596FFC|nr:MULTISPECIES: HAD family hydrolase [Campylobacter]MCV3409354.1 HAD family hydrolase [Campylobacter sp. IFREMER_LSEM_CL1890]TDJ90742.1 HAD family hydrolase [Campylobacter lari]HEC1797242.1 HAD family hydrolase [Campylobacter lari]
MLKKTILFDLDGTLIDSTSAILDGFDAAFKAFNEPLRDHEAIKALIGFPLDVAFEKLGVAKEKTSEYVNAYRKVYQKIYIEQTSLLPLAKESVYEASLFADLAVVTTKSSKFSKPLLDHLGIGEHFKVIIGRDDVTCPKPDAEPILLALKKLSKNKENAFMVGDTHLDIKAAQNANIIPVAVSSGYESKESLAKFEIPLFKNTYEAIKYIRNIR